MNICRFIPLNVLSHLTAREYEQRRREQREHHVTESFISREATKPFCADVEFIRRDRTPEFHHLDDDRQQTHEERARLI